MGEPEISRQLASIFKELKSMNERVTAIDTAIQGDDERGLVGMKQHMSTFRSDLQMHIVDDAKQFTMINRLKWAFGGMVALGTFCFGVGELISKFIK